MSCCAVKFLHCIDCFKHYANYNSCFYHFVLPGCAIQNMVFDRKAMKLIRQSTTKLESIQACVKDIFKNDNEETTLRNNFQSTEKVPVCYKHYVFTSSIFIHLIL
jgi:hypothetical protein